MSLPNAARAILTLVVCFGTATGAAARADLPPLPSRSIAPPVPVLLRTPPDDFTSARAFLVEQWTSDYEEWKAWFERWHNRREPGWWSARERRPRPDPPAWLPALCATLVEDQGPLADGCRAWEDWSRNDYLALLTGQGVVRTRIESPPKSIWWQHLHFDALWPMTQSGTHAYGVFGTHVTLPLTGRVQVFLAPGAILMRLPARNGSQAWSMATDWGFSYRVANLVVPVLHRPSSIHLNIARIWLLGTNEPRLTGDMYLVGFSLSLRPR